MVTISMKRNSIVTFVCTLLVLFLQSFSEVVAAVPGDEHWDNQFGPAGANDILNTVATFRGKVYIGGWFTGAGNSRANFIAGYDGTNWFPLNNGISGGLNTTLVFTLTSDSNYLYVGGWFTNADGSGAKYLGRWDGSSWSPLGNNTANNPNSIVEALKVVGSDLYVGGVFTTNGAVVVNRIARWDGNNWFALGSGISGGTSPYVGAIEHDGANLYVGGTFNQAGGNNATNVAKWNGSSWSALGNGLPGPVRSLTMHGGVLYAAGSFTNSTLAITNLAQWNGSTWLPVGTGANRTVWDLVSDGTTLYAGGNFNKIDGTTAVSIARWNGGTWSPLGAGLNGFGIGSSPLGAYKLCLTTNGLFAAGVFNQAGTVGCSHVAKWDGTNWTALGGTVSKGTTHFIGTVRALRPDGTNFYAGGSFTEAGQIIVNGIAKWNGTNWAALGGGLTSPFSSSTGTPTINDIVVSGNDVYAAGNFTNASGVIVKGVAHWDGNSWQPMGAGFNNTVNTLVFHKGVLFAGGTFTGLGNGTGSLHGIAQWDGSTWQDVPLIESWRVNNSFSVLISDGTDLYAGGNFLVAWGFSPQYPDTGAVVNNLGRWDGSFWWPIGASPNNTVASLALNDGTLYAGGSFTSIGGVTANRIAKATGTNWSAVGGSGVIGSTASASVSAIVLKGNDVIIAGSFTNAGGVTGINTPGLAVWDGTTWSTLGSGIVGNPNTATASALALINNDLYVGGSFIFAGDKPSMFIARWNDQLNFYPPPHPLLSAMTLTSNQPRFRLTGTSGERYILQGSSNLTNWTPLLTNSALYYDFIDTSASNANSRFYRAIVTP